MKIRALSYGNGDDARIVYGQRITIETRLPVRRLVLKPGARNKENEFRESLDELRYELRQRKT